MHLIEKNAEERYQSASGFLFDLIQVKEILEGRRKETDFILASKDFSAQFRIPEKLFGRTKEIADLHEAYRTILDGKKPFILISGYSGVGKSALVHEIHKPSIELRGLFIEGKFDQYQKNLPYSAWIQSFKEFVKNILTENEISLEKWKNIILDAVGTNGKVLTDIVPDLQFIIGHQPDVIELGPVETVNRFNTVLTNFIQHIATKDHPLAIFLDDWQWADLASLELLKVILLNPEIKNTLIICAYRDNEVDKNHPFAITLEQIKSKNIVPKEIVVSELNLETVEEIVYQSLGSQNKILAKMIHSKTKGNAFFLNEFLKSIHKENLLILDYRTGKWNPDLEKIQNLNITDNVVDLIVSKVRKLNPDTLELLKYGTCIGSQFDIGLLSIICKQSNIDIIKKLETALIDGLIFNTKSVTKYNF
ncbi:MAG TPA: AAA family ATPase, partial [Leptospiraceae bacterium]|nr:AAA family ATPase [Leptospiraceae bacterium]